MSPASARGVSSLVSALALGAAVVVCAPTALASDEEPVAPSGKWFRPTAVEPPADADALATVQALLDAVQAEAVTTEWLALHFRPSPLPTAPSDEWYARYADALSRSRPLGAALASSLGPVATIPGPDYTRVMLDGPSRLSVVVRRGDDDVLIDRIEATTCSLCPEPSRFVRDLLADIRRRGPDARRLLPGVELEVEGWMDQTSGLIGSHWLSAMQTRNYQGGELAWRLAGASLVGADGQTIQVQYGDGGLDTWQVVYRHGTWRVDYATLPEESPLRMSRAEVDTWRKPAKLSEAAVERWEPSWNGTSDGAGVQIGYRATGAVFDPRDGTVLVTVLDLDRVLSAVFRVDPELEVVVERWPMPAAEAKTAIPLGTWFERWQTSVSSDGRLLAMTSPSRVWTLDLRSGRSDLLTRIQHVSVLAYQDGDRHGHNPLLVADDRGDVLLFDPGPTFKVEIDAPPVVVDLTADGIVAITEDGTGGIWPVDGGEPVFIDEVCCGAVVSAALHPDGSEALVTCAPGCDQLGVRVPLPAGDPTPLPGAPTGRKGVSFSPDGTFFTTGAAGATDDAILLWDAATDRPIATLGDGSVRAVSWSAEGDRLVTLGTDGTVWLWDVAIVLQRRGL